MKYQQILQIAIEQTAIDMNCLPEDLIAPRKTVVASNRHPKMKGCYREKPFCAMAFYGNGLVASVDPVLLPFMETFISRYESYRYFDTPQLIALESALAQHDKTLCFLAECFLPDPEIPVEIDSNLQVVILEGPEIESLYGDKRFKMALSYKCDESHHRRDVIAAVGYIDGFIAGVAGATNESETMWQIGIDVLPNYQRQGVATTLTKRLSDEIIQRGKVPYYCTAWSHIASKRNAAKSGFRAAWVELAAADPALAKGILAFE